MAALRGSGPRKASRHAGGRRRLGGGERPEQRLAAWLEPPGQTGVEAQWQPSGQPGGAGARGAFSYEDVEGFQSWRRNVAHDYKDYQAATGETLVKRMCAQDSGLELSGAQALWWGA